MAILATDSFNGTDGDGIETYSSDWTENLTGSNFFIDSAGTGLTSSGSTNENGAFYNAVSWPNDHYAEVTIAGTASTGASFLGPSVRGSSGGNNYHFYSDLATHYVAKNVSNTWTQISYDPSTSIGSGDSIRLEAVGTSLETFINDISDSTDTDSSLSSGSAGVSGYEGVSTFSITDWEGGDFGYSLAAEAGSYTLTGSDVTFTYSGASGATAAFKVQHLEDDIGNSGGTNTSFTAISSLNNAIEIPSNNRKTHAGDSGSSSNLEGDDLAGGRVLTATDTLTYYRESASKSANMRFNTQIWEYIGAGGGANEFITRGRYAVALNGTTNSTTQAVTGVTNAADCIPFITGIMNNATTDDADSGTAVAYLEDSTTLRVQKGSNGNNVTVYVTLVEFTGSNWTVLHGDSGDTSGDSGTITLRDGSDGTGTATDVSDWANALIVESQMRGDTGASGANDAISDLWPIFEPGSNDQSVDFTYNSDHDSAGTNRQFVHVLDHSGMTVTRFSDTANAANESTIDITSAGVTDTAEALIIGSSTSSGGGTAYGRGWRNYYFNSTTEAAHWAHRSGNTMAHRLQVAVLPQDTGGGGPDYTLTAEAGSYALTGAAASLLASRTITAEQGTYTLTGSTADLLAGRNIAAESGSYSLSGSSSNLLISRRLAADSGSYVLSGADAGLTVARVLNAASGAYNLTGAAANLLSNRRLVAEGGSYTLAGSAATLTYNTGSATYTLTAEAGTYVLSGAAVELLVGRKLEAEQGAYSLTGADVDLLAARVIQAQAGSYNLTGEAASLLLGRKISAEAGSYALNGFDTQLRAHRTIEAESGSYTLTGGAVFFDYSGTLRGSVVALVDALAYRVEIINNVVYSVEVADNLAESVASGDTTAYTVGLSDALAYTVTVGESLV